MTSNDVQRMFDSTLLLPHLIEWPVIAIAGTIYTVYILGWWAILGTLVFLSFYPYQVIISRANRWRHLYSVYTRLVGSYGNIGPLVFLPISGNYLESE